MTYPRLRRLLSAASCALGLSAAFAQAGPRTPELPRPNALFASEGSVAAGDFFASYRLAGPGVEWVADARVSETPGTGLHHRRYRQRLHGLPVVGATYVLHADDAGRVRRANGRYYAHDTDLPTPTAALDAASAERQALRAVAATQLGNRRGDYAVEHLRLVYVDPVYPDFSGRLALAYEIEVARARPADRLRVYVDAMRGREIVTLPLIAHATVPGRGLTGYYGWQDFDVDSLGPGRYELRDEVRGIEVTSATGFGVPASASASFDLTALGERGAMAVDVHYGASRFYDLLADRYAWAGIDGQGERLVATVADVEDDAFVNAYWNGTEATFGGGDCHYKPLTTLDVVGHEFQHGVTQRTSDLVYRGESGALNEGLSDIFGKALELHEQPAQFSWELGNGFADSPYARGFRSMADPTLFGNPRVYRGDLWRDGAGVHTNSGPLGHWFYLLVEGGRGVNELGDAYDVDALGLDDALEVAFLANRDYFTETTTYPQAYAATMAVAEDLHGVGTPTYLAFEQAWLAIGLPGEGGPGALGPDANLFSVSQDQYCHPPGEVAVEVAFRLANAGVPPGEVLQLALDPDGPTAPVSASLPLPDGIGAGDFFFETVTFPWSAGTGDFEATLTVRVPGDTIPGNDDTRVELSVYNAAVDLGIGEVLWLGEPCDTSDGAVEFVVDNRACGPFTGDADLTLFDERGDIVSTVTLNGLFVAAGLPSYQTVRIGFAEAWRVASVKLAVRDDEREDNDTLSVRFPLTRPLTVAHPPLDFEVPASGGVQLVGDPDDFGVAGVHAYRGDRWFVTGGGSHFGSRLPCLDLADNFTDRFSEPPMVCVSAERASSIALDVLQFHADPDPQFPELAPYGRGLRVEWLSGDGFTREYEEFASLDEAVAAQLSVALPDGYAGPVWFNAYNHEGFGRFWDPDFDPDFADGDFTLFDDIRLTGVSSTASPATGARLAPNPASGLAVLTLDDHADSVEVTIVDALGRTLDVLHAVGGSLDVPTAAYPPGSYVLLLRRSGSDALERLRLQVQR